MISKLIIFFLLLTLIGSCSSAPYSEIRVDPELQIYLDSFIADSKGMVLKSDMTRIGIKIKKYKKDNDAIGTCYIYNGKITISEEWWERATFLEKKEVIFHELGHCVLLRPHTSPPDSDNFWGFLEGILFKMGILNKIGFLKDGCPASLMHPHTIGYGCITEHYVYYINELYRNSRLYKKRKNIK